MDFSVAELTSLLVAAVSLLGVIYQYISQRSKAKNETLAAKSEATESESQAAQALSEAAVAMLEPYKQISTELRGQNAQLTKERDEERNRHETVEISFRNMANKLQAANQELKRKSSLDDQTIQVLRDENSRMAFQVGQLTGEYNDSQRMLRVLELQQAELIREYNRLAKKHGEPLKTAPLVDRGQTDTLAK